MGNVNLGGHACSHFRKNDISSEIPSQIFGSNLTLIHLLNFISSHNTKLSSTDLQNNFIDGFTERADYSPNLQVLRNTKVSGDFSSYRGTISVHVLVDDNRENYTVRILFSGKCISLVFSHIELFTLYEVHADKDRIHGEI